MAAVPAGVSERRTAQREILGETEIEADGGEKAIPEVARTK